jgi:hypothetical protein
MDNISYTWKVTQTNHEISNGFIFSARFSCIASDGKHTSSMNSTSSWQDSLPITPYADVTESQVLQWIWDNGVDKASIEESLASNIVLQKDFTAINALPGVPTTATGTPWGNP